MNASGDVVGWGFLDAAETQQSAFVYTDQIGFKRLNDLIDPASGWNLLAATAINQAQEIVGWGTYQNQSRAFRLRLGPQQIACGSPNVCGGGNLGEICVWAEGVVDTGEGHYVAVFRATRAPTRAVPAAVNEVHVNPVAPNFQPVPPVWRLLDPDARLGLPAQLAPGQTISWTIDGKTATATAPAAIGAPSGGTRVLPRVSIGAGGYGVMIGGELVVLKADLTPYRTPPETEPTVQREPLDYMTETSAAPSMENWKCLRPERPPIPCRSRFHPG